MYSFNRVRFFCSLVTYIDKPIKLVKISEKVKISGWVKSIRQVKLYTFIHVCDNTTPTPLQVVLTNDSSTKITLSFGSYIQVRGFIVKSSAPGQDIEMQAKSQDIDFISPCDSLNYPFKAKEEHTLEYMRQYPHLRGSQEKFAAILKARNELTFSLHDYFRSNNFLNVHTPVITTNDCEGTNEIFNVNSGDGSKKFFKTDAYLTVSAQLHLEALAASGLSKVYTLGPIFRAEASNTRHHLAEFLMLEAELCPITDINQLAELVMDLMVRVYGKLADSKVFIEAYNKLNNGPGVKKDFYQRHKHVLNRDFAILNYSAASDILVDRFDPSFAPGSDLGKKHERYLSSQYCGGKSLFILNFPAHIKPFYAAKVKGQASDLASSLDLLMPDVGEICGGTLREGDYQTLAHKISVLDKITTTTSSGQHPLNWYLELRRFGYPPMAGFGIGYDRLVMNLLGLSNIRDANPFPRYHQNCQL